jgi:methionine aminopeptidase
VSKCVSGAVIAEICQATDEFLSQQAKTVYSKLTYKGLTISYKNSMSNCLGIGFPTIISPKHVICHFSPVVGDKESHIVMQEGDFLKVEVCAHVDGFAAQVAGTVVVGGGVVEGGI